MPTTGRRTPGAVTPTDSTLQPGPLDTFAPDLFRGRTALVTGGGRGIGRRIALGFARLGANVVIASRKPENLDATARELAALSAPCLALPTNIRETDQVEALVAAALERFGTIDFLVNNAGGQFPARPSAISDRGWRAVVDLNLNGTWNVCSRVVPHMIERRFGSIVNVVHVYSFDRGAIGFAHSGAARAGVVNLTKTLSWYLARQGVTINALAPGTVSTRGVREEEFAHSDWADFEARVAHETPAKRLADADEIAAVALFLCSPAARYINGATVVADGGAYVGNWPPMWESEEY